jgi:hypothetical protein
MKHVLAVLIFAVCSGLLSAQDQLPGRKYPYRIVSSAETFPVGNYIFKNDFDYVNYINKDNTKLTTSSAFFYPNESGVVLSREFSSGSYGFAVDRVEETDDQVIIYAKVIKPKGAQTCDMAYRCLFVCVELTLKHIVIVETTE